MKSAAVFSTCFLLLAITGLCFITTGKKENKKTSLILHFQHTLGGEALVLGNTYTTILGENIIIQKFKYYVSNFSVTDDLGKTTKLPLQYFLVDEADSLSQIITLHVPPKSISSIRFVLGVDSIRNVSGVQTGALDPLQGMFWTWNSGYIMAKLEGSSEASKSPGHYFTYHIGGFKKELNATRSIELKLSPFNKTPKKINIRAEINQWFKSRSEIRIAETPICHSPGALAIKMADNYRNMFSIKNIQ